MISNFDRYQRIAPLYDLLDLPFERRRYQALRPMMFQNLGGRLLDAGIGTGRNCAFYPPDAIVSGIDTSPAMLQRAHRRCPTVAAGGRLYQMDVTNLEFPAASFDSAENLVASSNRVASFACWNMCDRTELSGGSCREFGSRGSHGHTGRALTGTQKTMCPRPGLNWWKAAMSWMIS